MHNQKQSHQKKDEKALVIGAGIAGLLTARVLSDYYQDVIVIEKDELTEKPSNRKGTPQDFHPHRVLPRGDIIMNRFFPDYMEDLFDLGAHNAKNDKVINYSPFGTLEITINQRSVASSRPLLEFGIRQRVQELENVKFLSRQSVRGLVTSDDNKEVTGVQVKERNGNKEEGTIPANLVVDTSGRYSKLNKWLTDMGYNVPEQERLQVRFGYSTRYYQVPAHISEKLSGISRGVPEENVGSVGLFYIENNMAQTILFNAGGSNLPSTNTEDFDKQLNEWASPMINDLIKELKPIEAPRGYRAAESVRQHYEQMESWPSGLLVLGDAFCNFDPIYGQGMTVAAIEAEMLAICLEEKDSSKVGFEHHVLQRMQQAIEPAWWLSSIEDLRWRGVEHVGNVPLKGVTFAQKYFNLYLRHAMKQAKEENDLSMFHQYMKMNGLIDSPSEIINPEMLNTLITGDGSPEEEAVLAELGELDMNKMQKRLNELMPSFSLAFDEKVPDLFST
ncbi:NAD(P)/FAD-dependent oxidoreductase [Gracilibacillus salinarum]|uniref:FAD-binding protein n=1 Tax=Gracilibacillus salinarum TaxID=2932255 RepID=A0ABY4GMG9_9BACI|nr:FAD-binding protein [Gracilibacillus salinarum]UOQ84562.1 FAD-binding protein [Gracilibacillus salinarum]